MSAWEEFMRDSYSAQGMKSTLSTLIAGEDIANDVLKTQQKNSYTYISTATTTVVKTGAGFLHRILISGGTIGNISVFDNTAASGTAIAYFDSAITKGSYEINVSFATGLTIVTSTTVNVTVAWS